MRDDGVSSQPDEHASSNGLAASVLAASSLTTTPPPDAAAAAHATASAAVPSRARAPTTEVRARFNRCHDTNERVLLVVMRAVLLFCCRAEKEEPLARDGSFQN